MVKVRRYYTGVNRDNLDFCFPRSLGSSITQIAEFGRSISLSGTSVGGTCLKLIELVNVNGHAGVGSRREHDHSCLTAHFCRLS
jgi:hypothetical protein